MLIQALSYRPTSGTFKRMFHNPLVLCSKGPRGLGVQVLRPTSVTPIPVVRSNPCPPITLSDIANPLFPPPGGLGTPYTVWTLKANTTILACQTLTIGVNDILQTYIYELTNHGKIVNNGEIISGSDTVVTVGITNNGKITNSNTIINNKKTTIKNNGTITNDAKSVFTNHGTITNNGTITNATGSTFTNDGTINGSGKIN
jgi:hypothetical protein